MKAVVKNEKKDITVEYKNVETVIKGSGMFIIFMEDGETATFHNIDEDGDEWICFTR